RSARALSAGAPVMVISFPRTSTSLARYRSMIFRVSSAAPSRLTMTRGSSTVILVCALWVACAVAGEVSRSVILRPYGLSHLLSCPWEPPGGGSLGSIVSTQGPDSQPDIPPPGLPAAEPDIEHRECGHPGGGGAQHRGAQPHRYRSGRLEGGQLLG